MNNWILFDFNGTLLDDQRHTLNVINEMRFENSLVPLTQRDYLSTFCFPIKDFYLKTGWCFKQKSFEEVSKEFIEKYYTAPLPSAFKGLDSLFDELKESGYRLGVLSASKQDRLEAELLRLQITHHFEKIMGIENDLAQSKSHRLKRFKEQESNSQIIIIGDTTHDAEIAKEHNCEVNLILSGHQNQEQFAEFASNTPIFSNLLSWKDFLIGS